MDWTTLISDMQTWGPPALAGLAVGILLAALVGAVRLSRLRTRIALAEASIKHQVAVEEEREQALEKAESDAA